MCWDCSHDAWFILESCGSINPVLILHLTCWRANPLIHSDSPLLKSNKRSVSLNSCRFWGVRAPAVGARCPAASPLSASLSWINFWKVKDLEEATQQSGGSPLPVQKARRGIPAMEEEGGLAAAPTELQVKASASFVTPPATAPRATAPPVTAHHATATPAMRGGGGFAATPACLRWRVTGSPAALCSPPRKRKMRRAPLSQYLMEITALTEKSRAGQRGGRADGRRPGAESRGIQLWRGPVIRTASVRLSQNNSFTSSFQIRLEH